MIEQFIRSTTKLKTTKLLPEIRMYIGGDPTKLWQKTQDFLIEKKIARARSMSPPFWAWPWAGGQAMAREILDRPEHVRGKRVLDAASGCGVIGIAAAMSGASHVSCVDLDPIAEHAARMNARENGVEIEARTVDLATVDTNDIDVILAGDLFYESAMSEKLFAWLRHEARSRVVLASDPNRTYSPKHGVEEIASHLVFTNLTLEARLQKHTRVYRVLRR